MSGETISHYRVVEKLGAGGMGVVYKAHDLNLNRPVALKFLSQHLPLDEEDRQRFLREAQAAAALDHPNICTVHEIDEVDGERFIVMAFLDGRPLSVRIKEGPLELREAVAIAIQMAEGLEAAHRKGVVHRDIKPANVMLVSGSRPLVKLMDFGLAQLAGASKLTRKGLALGTVAYMSPEQGEGLETDSRTDIWSLGVVLYEMVAGRTPFRADFEPAIVYAILNEPAEPLSAVRAGVPKELERIVSRCMAKQREHRYQHVEEALADLQALYAELGPSASGTGSARSVRAQRAPAPVLGVVAAGLAAAALGWWFLQSRGSRNVAPPEYTLRQITRDAGYTGQPSLSSDGRLLAYASDRSGEGNLDIWVQQLGGGDPIRVTTDPADDDMPSLSPDGNRVVFRSGRAGSGIYIAPALGGAERRIAENGTNPRFSPDGAWISYSEPEFNEANQIFWRAYLTPSSGGPRRRVETNLAVFVPSVWSPDGKQLLGLASSEPSEQGRASDHLGWSLAPAHGGDSIPLDRTPVAGKIDSLVGPGAWLADGGWVVYDDDVGGVPNLWRVQVPPGEDRIVGEPQRLTLGAGELAPSASQDGRIAFVSAAFDQGIWALALDAEGQGTRAEPRRTTSGLSTDSYPSVTRDGRLLVYTSDRAGNNDIWMRDMNTGRDTPLTDHPGIEDRGVISPDGAQVAFSRDEQVYLLDIRRGAERLLLENIGRHTSWTPDGKSVLYYTDSPIQWKTVEVETGRSVDLGLAHPQFPIHSVQFSPDQAWVSLKLQGAPGTPLFVAPVINGVVAGENRWIPIAQTGSVNVGHNWWSPDGSTLYYLSDRDGFICIAAQPLDPKAKAPKGPVRDLHHFHGRLRPPPGSPSGFGLATGLLYFPLRETKANVWLAEPHAAAR